MKEATKEQLEAAAASFKADKFLKVLFATSDNQVFADKNFAFAHAKTLQNEDMAEIAKEDTEKKKAEK